ncbi:hypothetical protein BDW69DRAFT_154656 [Aspergillus filifer]
MSFQTLRAARTLTDLQSQLYSMYSPARCLSSLHSRRGRHRRRHRRHPAPQGPRARARVRGSTRGIHNRSRRARFPLSSLFGMVFPRVTIREAETETHCDFSLLEDLAWWV